ncbi:MAG TPA: YetF domain-containing protein [Longimicrobiales bacterium]|nr:YetF domain-containing protein [Longimicrobiales bacterium]
MIEVMSYGLDTLLGLGSDAGEIGPGQMALRAVIIYGFTLFIVRLGSKRFLGKATAFDVIMGIMIGSVMSRAINGSAGLLATLGAGAVLVGLHWLFGVISYHAHWFGKFVKGTPVKLIEDGEVREEAMRGSSLSRNDLEEALRLEGMNPDPSRVALAYLERDGSISVIPREHGPRVVEIKIAEGVQTARIELS